MQSARPDWSKARGARPSSVERPSGSRIPKGAGKPGGAKGPGKDNDYNNGHCEGKIIIGSYNRLRHYAAGFHHWCRGPNSR
ncbi:MAG: hypothetical protein MZV63_68130 [Marinilabiliales bacterium]|nr:hypothetical protein [Marinilabiliales bacterium]